MSWMLVGSAAVSFASGLLGGGSKNAAANAQYVSQKKQEVASYNSNIADNKSIVEANLQNTIRTGYKVGLLNLQKANAQRDLLAQGFGLSRAKVQVLGAATANTAASGSVGSSVDAVLSDIEMKAGEASAELDYNWAQTNSNFDTTLTDLIYAGKDAQQSARAAQVISADTPGKVSIGEIAVGSILNTAGSYAMSKMKLGLGT